METTTAKPKNAVILYRGNQSLDLIAPVITEAVRDKYRLEIATQRFDPRTTPDEIGDWYHEHWSDLESALIISDRTCYDASDKSEKFGSKYNLYRGQLKLPQGYNFLVDSLDQIAANSAVQFVQTKAGCFDEKIILESANYQWSEGYGLGLEQTRQAYISLLSHVNEKPSHIFIVRDCLDNHLPFKKYSNNDDNQRIIRSWLEEGLGLDVPITEHYRVPSLPDNGRPFLTKTGERVEVDLSSAWIVIDRHASGRQTGSRITRGEIKYHGYPESVIFLRLPLEEFIQDAISQGVYDQQFKDFEPEYLRLVKANIIQKMQRYNL